MHSASSDASTLPPERTAQTSPSGGSLHLARQQRRHAHRPGALHHELRALKQEHHGLRHLVVRHRHHLVHEAIHERQRHLPRPLDGDAVADGVGEPRAHRAVGLQRGRVRRAGVALDAHDAHVGQLGSRRHRRAADQPSATEGHDDQARPRRLSRDLEANGALTRHHVRVVEGMHDGVPLLLGQRPSALGRVVDGALDEAHLPAVLAHGRHLRHGRAGWHEQRGRRAGLAGREGHGLPVVARAGRHDPSAPAAIRQTAAAR